MVVASVARLFEEVICSGCLCASDLGFVPVFRLDARNESGDVVVEWLLRLLLSQCRLVLAGDLVAVHCTSSSGVPVKMVSLPVSRREFSFGFFCLTGTFFFFVLIDSSYLAWGREVGGGSWGV